MKKSNTKLVACPLCHTYYSAKKSSDNNWCDECGVKLFDVDFDYDEYLTFSDEEKAAFKEKYTAEHFADYVPPFKPLPKQSFSGFVGCCGVLSLAGLLIVGFIVFMMGSFGAGIALMISAPLAGGTLILFSNVADDVRHIRNRVDQFYHNEKYKKS